MQFKTFFDVSYLKQTKKTKAPFKVVYIDGTYVPSCMVGLFLKHWLAANPDAITDSQHTGSLYLSLKLKF